MHFALNHMTVPRLSYSALLDLAARLGCIGVEVRNDIAQPLFDNLDPRTAGQMAQDKGLRLIGLSQVYPFNDWSAERALAVQTLISTAQAAGAETISLIPRNDGTQIAEGTRQANLKEALTAIAPMLEGSGLVALVEPLGFQRSSLRSKAELAAMLKALEVTDRFRMVHDTFHHTLAQESQFYPELTGLVHISGVIDPTLSIDEMEDVHRLLIDAQDRLGNIEQLRALIAQGYTGPISYECFAPEIHALADPYTALKHSLDFMTSHLAVEAVSS